MADWQELFREFHAVVIPVTDMAAGRDWYENTLGLEPRKIVGDENFGLTVYQLQPSAHLCLFKSDETGGTQTVFFNLRTEDARATRDKLLARGVDCTDINADGPVTWFSMHDPFGTRIDCCEYGTDWLED